MFLTNKTVLITGGGSGIGLEFARQLLKQNNKVIITGRNLSKLEAAKKEFPNLVIIQSDVSKNEEIIKLHKIIMVEHPELSVLINNAGVGRAINFSKEENTFDVTEEIQINLQGPIQMIHQFLPDLLKQKDSMIINVTSALAFSPYPKVPIYSATKAGLHSFTKSLRVQLKRTHVRVIEVAPPTTQTEMIEGFGSKELKKLKIMTTKEMVQDSMKSIEKGMDEICPGQSSQLRFMSRLAPQFILKQMSGKF